MSKLSGKIFPDSWKNFSVQLEKFFRTVGVKVKVIFFSQVEKSPEKNLNNSVVHRKVQNNPEKVCDLSSWVGKIEADGRNYGVPALSGKNVPFDDFWL